MRINKTVKGHVISVYAAFIITFSLLINSFCYSIGAVTSVSNDGDLDIYRYNRNDEMNIALTFDDGPHPRLTPKILDVLDKYGIKATFFVIGVNAEYYPSALSEIVNQGHEIGNHTYSHPHINDINKTDLKSEIEKCENTLLSATNCRTRLFRPPEGMIDGGVKSVLKNLDYKVILWDIDTRDWAQTPPQEIASHVIKNIKSGDIILMHDYISYNSPTVEALEIFVPILIEKGYNFVVISELIGLKK